MKKYIIIATVFTACLALCAAVWPQSEKVGETPAPIQAAAVSAPKSIVEEIATEAETTLPTEEEKAWLPQAAPLHEDSPEPEPALKEVPEIAEVSPALEAAPEPEPVSAPELTPEPAPSQTVSNPQSGDMVYVPGFGWLECQGPGEVIYAEDMYENGNKVGVMG